VWPMSAASQANRSCSAPSGSTLTLAWRVSKVAACGVQGSCLSCVLDLGGTQPMPSRAVSSDRHPAPGLGHVSPGAEYQSVQ
jgi:hypothetical protein